MCHDSGERLFDTSLLTTLYTGTIIYPISHTCTAAVAHPYKRFKIHTTIHQESKTQEFSTSAQLPCLARARMLSDYILRIGLWRDQVAQSPHTAISQSQAFGRTATRMPHRCADHRSSEPRTARRRLLRLLRLLRTISHSPCTSILLVRVFLNHKVVRRQVVAVDSHCNLDLTRWSSDKTDGVRAIFVVLHLGT